MGTLQDALKTIYGGDSQYSVGYPLIGAAMLEMAPESSRPAFERMFRAAPGVTYTKNQNNYQPVAAAPQPIPKTPNNNIQQPTPNNNLDAFNQAVNTGVSQYGAPFSSNYYSIAAQNSNGLNYNNFLSGSNNNPYYLNDSMWSQYGNGGDMYNMNDSIAAYMRLTGDNYNWLKSELGRDPSEAEVYAASQMGRDDALSAINSNNMGALQPYISLFV